MLEPLHFSIDVFYAEDSWWYRVSNGRSVEMGKAPSRGSALQEGYKKLMEVIKSTINE